MENQETKRRFIELRASGLSYAKIAAELGVSKQTLIEWSKDFEYEIANLKAIELETLVEQYGIASKHRIEVFAEKYRAIRDELAKRKLSDIPTERLFDLVIKLNNVLKQESIQPVFSEAFDGTIEPRIEKLTWAP